MKIVSENRFSGKTYFYTIGSRGRDITDELGANQFTYDPQRGLVIDRGTMVYHTGLIICEASKEGSGKSNMYRALLQFIPVEQPKTPSILEQGGVAQAQPVAKEYRVGRQVE